MNHHDRDRSRPEHLSDILNTLADSAAETHAGRTPEALLATARRHGAAVRALVDAEEVDAVARDERLAQAGFHLDRTEAEGLGAGGAQGKGHGQR